jgi:hypothetical protein
VPEATWKTGGRTSVGCVLATRGCSSPRRAPFAAPLLGLIDAESGGFHLNSLTSSGKTTALLTVNGAEVFSGLIVVMVALPAGGDTRFSI